MNFSVDMFIFLVFEGARLMLLVCLAVYAHLSISGIERRINRLEENHGVLTEEQASLIQKVFSIHTQVHEMKKHGHAIKH